jgi:hypothetical protein
MLRAVAIISGSGTVATTSSASAVSREINIANARLIAAAPELLAALRAVADYWAGGDVPPDIDAAMRAAILKATGGTP